MTDDEYHLQRAQENAKAYKPDETDHLTTVSLCPTCDSLSVAEAHRFNRLVKVALALGKPIESAYEYAHTIMDEQSNNEKG